VRVVQHIEDEPPVRRVEKRRHLADEVVGDTVPDICLGERLQPVLGPCLVVISVQCGPKRRHRLRRIGPKFGQPVGQPPVAGDLRGGQFAQ